MPFFEAELAGSETIPVERKVDPDEITTGAGATWLDILLELFDEFGRNNVSKQIRSYQEAFYRREFR